MPNTHTSSLPHPFVPGEIARSYFDLATSYYKVWTCCLEPGVVDRYLMSPWMESVMRQWHALDPVCVIAIIIIGKQYNYIIIFLILV